MHFCLLYSLALATALPVAAQITFNPVPTREIGQAKLSTPVTSFSPNLVEGREMEDPQGVAVDASANPPIVYVADTLNSRVLAWRNAGGFTKGDFADLVIGQRDQYSTRPEGPGTQFSTGLNRPTAVAVDKLGNLYVADAGNNRILRYPQPFAQGSGGILTIDLVIGQQGTGAGGAQNEGNGTVASAKTIYLSANNLFRTGMAFDAQGNLYFSDAGNNRVLRFPVGQLAPGTIEPTADLVLGQFDFVSNSPIQNQANTPIQQRKDGLVQPAGLAIDQSGRLYVCDDINRVLQYTPPFTNGAPATRILGVAPSPKPPVQVQSLAQLFQLFGNTLLGSYNNSFGLVAPPESVFTIGDVVYVVDTPNHRIVRFPSPDNGGWPAETATNFSPVANGVIGQPDLTQFSVNSGLKQPTASSLSSPVSAVFDGADLLVADSGNNRILAFPQQGAGNFTSATRVLGQLDFPFNAPNLIEGREVDFSDSGLSFGAGMVVDTNSATPHLYIADPGNNRVLGFNDVRKVKPGDKADIVIGQQDLFRALVDSPAGDPLQLTDSGFNHPSGVAVDGSGNLYVADSGNARVLRFPAPFNSGQNAGEHATLVLGQADFFTKLTDASARNMRAPYGLAFTFNGSLLVSDVVDNRVLFFVKPQGGDFTNGQAAFTAFGQPDFTTITPGSTPNRMNAPHGIATDTNDRLFVCDTGNNRVLVYTRVTTAGVDPSPTPQRLPGFSQPLGITIAQDTGDIWVADTGDNVVNRFPLFDNLVISNAPTATFSVQNPLAVTLDAFDNVLVAEATNRVSLYFPSLAAVNAASYFNLGLTPGMLATLAPLGGAFGTQTANFNSLPNPLPIPTALGDIQILVNGTPAPLLYVSPNQINFQVPMATPAPGQADIQVMSQSTGQIYGDSPIQMNTSAPAFFTVNGQGTGQIAAINQDNTLNSASNPAPRGSVIALYGTGQGFLSGAPADGNPADGAVPDGVPIQVIINGPGFVDPSNIQYFGLAPGFVGVWQLNVTIPANVPPGNQILVAITVNDNPSNAGPNNTRLVTTIAVKQ
ncbi:MAG: hypothetical protein ABI165_20725 [Bryobacteraceae bacterium]